MMPRPCGAHPHAKPKRADARTFMMSPFGRLASGRTRALVAVNLRASADRRLLLDDVGRPGVRHRVVRLVAVDQRRAACLADGSHREPSARLAERRHTELRVPGPEVHFDIAVLRPHAARASVSVNGTGGP